MKKFFIKIKIKRLIIALGLGLIWLFPMFCLAADETSGAGPLLSVVSWIVLFIVNFLGTNVLLPLINFVIELAQYNTFIDSYAVTIGWPLVRDICNMFFVVVLLIIAFSTILNISRYHYKTTLLKLVIMALLINFSKLIVGFMIDFAQVIMLTFVNAFRLAAVAAMAHSFGLANLLSIEAPAGGQIDRWEAFGTLMLGLIFMVVSAGTMLAYVVVLLYRIISLWVLVILSPFAFFALAFSGLNKYAAEYWSKFFQQLTTGVILSFFMWLSFSILASAFANPAMSGGATPALLGQSSIETMGEVTKWDRIYVFIIAIALMLLALQYAQQAGGFAGSFAGKVSGKLSDWGSKAARLPLKGAWGAAKMAGGYIGRKYSEKMPGWANPAALIRGFQERRKELHEQAKKTATARGKEAVERFLTGKHKKLWNPKYWNWLQAGLETGFGGTEKKVQRRSKARYNEMISTQARENLINSKKAEIDSETENRVSKRIEAIEKSGGEVDEDTKKQFEEEEREAVIKGLITPELEEAEIERLKQELSEEEYIIKIKPEVEKEVKTELAKIKKRAMPAHAAIPYEEQVEESYEAQYAKDYAHMDKNQMAHQAALLIGMKGVEGARRRRSLARVMAVKGYVDDTMLSKAISDHYGYDGQYSPEYVNHFLHSFIGFKNDGKGPIDNQGQRVISDLEDIGKDAGHYEYGGHNTTDPDTGKPIPYLVYRPGVKVNQQTSMLTKEEAAAMGCGTVEDLLEKLVTEIGKIGGRAAAGTQIHSIANLSGKGKTFNGDGKKTIGFAVDAQDRKSITYQALLKIFQGQDLSRIIEHMKPRTKAMEGGAEAAGNSVNRKTKEMHVGREIVGNLALAYSDMPDYVQAIYKSLGGRGMVKLRLHIDNEKEIDDLLNHLQRNDLIKEGEKEGFKRTLMERRDKEDGTFGIDEDLLARLAGQKGVVKTYLTEKLGKEPTEVADAEKAEAAEGTTAEAIQESGAQEAPTEEEIARSRGKEHIIRTELTEEEKKLRELEKMPESPEKTTRIEEQKKIVEEKKQKLEEIERKNETGEQALKNQKLIEELQKLEAAIREAAEKGDTKTVKDLTDEKNKKLKLLMDSNIKLAATNASKNPSTPEDWTKNPTSLVIYRKNLEKALETMFKKEKAMYNLMMIEIDKKFENLVKEGEIDQKEIKGFIANYVR